MKKNLLLTILSIIISLLIIEYLIGYWKNIKEIRLDSYLFHSQVKQLQVSAKYLRPNINHQYLLSDNKFRTDDMGFVKGIKAIDKPDTKILFIGGSTTENNEVNENYRFSYLVGQILSKQLGSEIASLNGGVRGNTTLDSINLILNHPSYGNFNHYIMMHNINDRLFLNQFGRYTFQNLNENEFVLDNFFVKFSNSLDHFFHVASYKSNILFFLRQTLTTFHPWNAKKIGLPNKTTINLFPKNKDYGKKYFERNLKSFVGLIRSFEKNPILMTQPLGEESSLQKDFNEIIRKVATKLNVDLIDLSRKMGSNPLYFLSDNIHFNSNGSKVAATYIVNFFLKKLSKESIPYQSQSNILNNIYERCNTKNNERNRVYPLGNLEGRYPTFSKDRKFLLYQNYHKGHDGIIRINIEKNNAENIPAKNTQSNNRHPFFIDNDNIIFGSNLLGEEKLFVYNTLSKKSDLLIKNSNLSSSIPNVVQHRVYFSGTILDDAGKALGPPDLYMYNTEIKELKQLTDTTWEEWRPAINENGDYLYYIANPKKQFDIYRLNLINLETELVYESPEDEWDPNLSQDGKKLIFASKQKGNWDLYFKDLQNNKTISLTNSRSDDWDPFILDEFSSAIFASANEHGSKLMFICF